MNPVEIHYLGNWEANSPKNDNADVDVYWKGRRYFITFITTENIPTIMNRHRQSGESANGSYFWCADMIIVETLSKEVVELAVEDLIVTGTLEQHFRSTPIED